MTAIESSFSGEDFFSVQVNYFCLNVMASQIQETGQFQYFFCVVEILKFKGKNASLQE